MSFTLIQLKHAMLVVKYGSFSEAARQSNSAQSSISNYVSDLEETLGKPLFSRSTRKVELTTFGKAMLPFMEDALASADRIALEARALIDPERKLLRIAFTPLLDIKRMNALCSAYRQSNPNVEIIFKECEIGDIEHRLNEEQIDVICGPNIKINSERKRCLLFTDPLHYIPPTAETTSLSEKITLTQIAKQTLLLTVGACGLAPATMTLFETEKLSPPIYPGRAYSHSGLQEWAELGIGGAILPASRISKNRYAQFPRVMLNNKHVSLSYEAVWLKSAESMPHLRSFFRSLPSIAKALAREAVEWN